MTRVFVAGSRRLALRAPARKELQGLCLRRCVVLVGDAAGTDRAVREFLAASGYDLVRVYYTAPQCRATGIPQSWELYEVSTGARPKTRAFYEAKDRAMSQDCSAGLMIWDANSLGTFRNILRLLQLKKPVTVCVSRGRGQHRLTKFDDLIKLITHLEPPRSEQLLSEVTQVASEGDSNSSNGRTAIHRDSVRQRIIRF